MDLGGAVILLTGGTGSFGTAFIERVTTTWPDAIVRIYSRDPLKQSQLLERFGNQQVRYLIGDVRDRVRLRRAAQGADILVHAAALKQVPACEYNPFEAIATNIGGAQNVVDASIDAGVERVLAISTDKAVNPVNLYGATKLCAEKTVVQGNAYASQSRTRLACVRYGNVIGSRGSVVPLFRAQAEAGRLTLTDTRMTRFWITLPQAVDLVLYALEHMTGGEIFIPKIPSMRLVDLADALGPGVPREIVGIRPGEKLHEVLITADESRHTIDDSQCYVVLPEQPWWIDQPRWSDGKPLLEGFSYASDTNDWWLSPDEMLSLMSSPRLHDERVRSSPGFGPQMRIGDRTVGSGQPTYIVAEVSANHAHDLDRALELVRLAAAAGADAVKIQTYRPDTMTIDADQPRFRISGGTPWDGSSLWSLYADAMTPWEWTGPLLEQATGCGVHLFSSPFDATAVEYLEQFNLPVYKIASFELVDLGLIRTVASTGRPLIMSTGMADVSEIAAAVDTAHAAGAGGVALLHCTSAYPSPPTDMNLRTIPHLRDGWNVPVGLSDHTLGTAASIAAVALGASIIEKHFTLSRREPGPDSAFSLEPAEFAQLTAGIREAEAALGTVRYGPSDAEKSSLAFRRSLFVVEDVRLGEVLTERNVRSIRPAGGLPPRFLPTVLGRRAGRDLVRGTPLSWDVIA